MIETAELPRIVISAEDLDRLQNVADAAKNTVPHIAEYLQQELDRASVSNAVPEPSHGVTMGSFVEFRDDTTGRVRMVQLVYPAEADSKESRIYVLTPLGAALIGLSEGQSIAWQTRGGERKTLTVLKVLREMDGGRSLDA
jgi:regulator of nucleoside diphosphate kinase